MLGRSSLEDESHNTYSLFGGPDWSEPLRVVMMGHQNGNRSQTPDSDSLFPSEMNEEDTDPEPMQQDPWFRARKFSEEDTTLVTQVEPCSKKLPQSSHLVYDPDVQMSDWTPEETDNWMRLDLASSVPWSMQTCRFSPQKEEQHIAGIVAAAAPAAPAAPCHRPVEPEKPKPRVVFTLPGDFFNFMEEEEEEEEPHNSLNPAE